MVLSGALFVVVRADLGRAPNLRARLHAKRSRVPVGQSNELLQEAKLAKLAAHEPWDAARILKPLNEVHG